MKYSFFITTLILLALNSFAQVHQDWVRIYNTLPDKSDYNVKLLVDYNENIISLGNNSEYEIIIVKYNKLGDTIWTKRYNFSQTYTEISDMQIDSLNNIYFTGLIEHNKILTFMLNESGEIVWSKILNTNLTIGLLHTPRIAVNSDIVIGFEGLNSDGAAYILKYDKAGNQLWMKNFANSEYTSLAKVLFDTDGNIIFTGAYFGTLTSNLDLYIIKLNPDGNLIWSKNYIAAFADRPYDLFIDSNNNSYVLAETGSDGFGFPVFSTFKYDSSGNIMWLSKYAATGFARDIPSAITLNNYNFITISYNSNGDINWIDTTSTFLENPLLKTSSLMIDNSGNIYSLGQLWTNLTNFDLITIKYYRYPISINPVSGEIPERFSLKQNFPNPFNPVTKIRFEIPQYSKVTVNELTLLKVFDVLGREVKTLVNQNLNPGVYEIEFDGSELAGGVYFYRLHSGEFTETIKMILIK